MAHILSLNILNLPDWFNADGGTDTQYPTKDYNEAIKKMGNEAENIFQKATEEVIKDQIECGIDILTDGEVRREKLYSLSLPTFRWN